MRVITALCAIGCALSLAGPTLASVTASAPEREMLKVDPRAHFEVVYDIHSAETAAGIKKGLYYARGLTEAYRKQGVEPAQLDINLVLHGDAAKHLLVDDAYQKAVDDLFAVNLNGKITQDLLDLGVGVEICHNIMRAKGWSPLTCCPA